MPISVPPENTIAVPPLLTAVFEATPPTSTFRSAARMNLGIDRRTASGRNNSAATKPTFLQSAIDYRAAGAAAGENELPATFVDPRPNVGAAGKHPFLTAAADNGPARRATGQSQSTSGRTEAGAVDDGGNRKAAGGHKHNAAARNHRVRDLGRRNSRPQRQTLPSSSSLPVSVAAIPVPPAETTSTPPDVICVPLALPPE